MKNRQSGDCFGKLRCYKLVKRAHLPSNRFSPVCGPGSPGLNEYGQQPPLWPEDIRKSMALGVFHISNSHSCIHLLNRFDAEITQESWLIHI